MNIYFACSITGGRTDESKYMIIVDTLLKDGHTIPTAHLSQQDVIEMESVIGPEEVYLRDTSWIDTSNALIAEVSTPSHGVGYEIAYALHQGKHVLCIYEQDKPISYSRQEYYTAQNKYYESEDMVGAPSLLKRLKFRYEYRMYE